MSQNTQPKNKIALFAGLGLLAVVAVGGLVYTSGKIEKKDPAAATDAAKTDVASDSLNLKAGDPVIATINGKEIKRSDALTLINQSSPQIRQLPVENLFLLAQEQLINDYLLAEKAKSANLDNDPKVKEYLEEAKKQYIRNLYLEREIDSRINDDRLQKSFQDLVAKHTDVEEVKASHILVENEATAKEVLTKLEAGEDFAKLAKEYSKDANGKEGGDLGYFTADKMVAEFSKAAFALNKGEYTKAPVKTQFGYHLIKVEDKRTQPKPEFEKVKPQLQANIRREVLVEILNEWQSVSKIEKFDINGEKVKEAPKADAKTEATEESKEESKDAPKDEKTEEKPAE
jgi:peptidyl-prolyl cis-trans isomerase C